MFTKDNVIFENDILITTMSHAAKYTKHEIIDTVCKYANQIAKELGVTIVSSILIDDIVLRPKILGEMDMAYQSIKLSYVSASNLMGDTNTCEFKQALSTLYHEFYHALDCEKIFLPKVYPEYVVSKSKDILFAHKMWTEFFATYSTFDIIENLNLYKNFKCVFDENKDITLKTYYTSRLMGYQIKSQHNILCDNLVSQYLDKRSTKQLSDLYQMLIQRYPNINIADLYQIHRLTNKCILKTVDFSTLKPISIKELINRQK